MGNGTSKTDINPYIFFPINTTGYSVKDKIDQAMKYVDQPCDTEFTFRGDEFTKFLNEASPVEPIGKAEFIETYGDNSAQTSAVRVLLVCKNDKGEDENIVDTLVRPNKISKILKGGDHDDSSDNSSSSSTSEIGDSSSSSSNSSSESTSDKEKHDRKHGKKHGKKHDNKPEKKEEKKEEVDSEGGSIHSYSLPTINSSDIRNMAENDILTSNSVMEEAINKYNKLQRQITMNTSERDLLTDSEKFVNKKTTKNNKYA